MNITITEVPTLNLGVVGSVGEVTLEIPGTPFVVFTSGNAQGPSGPQGLQGPQGVAGAVTSVAGKTGVVTLVKGDVGLGNVDNTSDAAKPVSTAQQTALNLKANLASPQFTGNVVAESSPASVGISALAGSNSGYESIARGSGGTAGAATIAFHRPTSHAVHFGLDTDNKLKVGGWSLGANAYAIYHENNKPTKADVGLGNVDNTADTAKPVSTAQQTALNDKANLASPALTGAPTAPTATPSDRDTSIATTEFVSRAISGQIIKDVSGGVDVTLSADEFCHGVVSFIGTLTANIGVIVPPMAHKFGAYNATTGAFTLTVKTATGVGVTVSPGQRESLWTDGLNVHPLDSDFRDVGLTGTPTAPTAAVGTNTTQLATTAFVNAEIANDAPTKTGGGASGTWPISVTGNAATATKIKSARTNWVDNGVITNVVGLLSWKNYSNGHVIFDASAGTSPDGGAVNNTDAQVAWVAPHPTLMGWNGANTYGVRVDSARVADASASVAAGADSAIVNQQNGNTGWMGRILSKNATSDKAAFVGTYGASVAGVFAHNNALTAWADLYINTVDGAAGGSVRMPATTYINGSQAIHAGNYNTYSPTLTGGNASGTWGIAITGNAGTATTLQTARTLTIGTTGKSFNGSANVSWTRAEMEVPRATATVDLTPEAAESATGYVANALFGQTDGALYTQVYSDAWKHQIQGDYRTGQIALRGKNSGTWQAWRTVLDSDNYNTYAPTKTGGGASGTWGISISGRASGLDGSMQTIRTTLAGATGNDYHNSALEVRGDGGTLVPAIGFHQPGKYASVLQQQGDGWFAFLSQGLGAYQSLRVAELSASGNVTAYSDIRLKTDIEKIPDALNKVTSLNGYTYTRTDTGVRQTGVIAQELLEVLPEAVSTAGEHMSVAYGNMAGLLIEAIKELNEKVSALTARVAELEAR